MTLAELSTGPHATDDPDERARRQARLPLYTRNPADFAGLRELLEIVPV